jgi:pimeloyl-ACP methyl ester carboxylesterase
MAGPASRAFREAESSVFGAFGLAPTAQYLELSEPSLTVRALETGAGEPVVFLHGITLCSAHWAPLVADLPGMRCIALDMPGHGDSGQADYSGVDLRRWHTRMLVSCLDRLGLDSAHVVGHSYGGMFGLWLALDAPQRVRSVVSIGVPSTGLGGRPDALFRMLAVPALGRLVLGLPSPPAVYRRLLAASLGRRAVDSTPPELLRATYLGTRRRGFPRTVSTYLREQFRGTRARPQRYVFTDRELERIGRPMLVVWGDRDRYQPVDEGRRRTSLMPNASFHVVPGGHEPWLDDPGRCTRLISEWFAPARRGRSVGEALPSVSAAGGGGGVEHEDGVGR